MRYQQPLPDRYLSMTEEELAAGIRARKHQLGTRLVILGHHYQRHDVIQFADFVGDSLRLAQLGTQQKQAEFIVFCGVHFMAEAADILTGDDVKVILPDLGAGCSLADMADIDQLEDAWEFFHAADGHATGIVPITYINSTAAIKAFCGDHGGACCTSGNATAMLDWAFEQGGKVLFLPDQHLGRNTAYSMGIPLEQMAVYDPEVPNGGLNPQQVREVKVLLWKGHCAVHQLFTVEQCDEIHRADAEYQILVHPECPWEVVQRADLAGSTEFIIRTIREAPAGSKWAIGTEFHLVDRLINNYPDKSIRSLAGIQCLCETMFRIDLRHLAWVLDELAAGRIVNQITVDPETTRAALVALDRMLANVPAKPIAIK
ncbi:MAG: quinolinate synthase NadA [Planctomycetes bacterium]|nr:quinolinate synthase NadA [Planctomycetota bacterium]